MKVVSGLGLQVMPSKAPRQEVQEEFREEEGDERIGGVDRVNEEGDEDGVRKLITGIRKHEKGGKENAEKVPRERAQMPNYIGEFSGLVRGTWFRSCLGNCLGWVLRGSVPVQQTRVTGGGHTAVSCSQSQR